MWTSCWPPFPSRWRRSRKPRWTPSFGRVFARNRSRRHSAAGRGAGVHRCRGTRRFRQSCCRCHRFAARGAAGPASRFRRWPRSNTSWAVTAPCRTLRAVPLLELQGQRWHPNGRALLRRGVSAAETGRLLPEADWNYTSAPVAGNEGQGPPPPARNSKLSPSASHRFAPSLRLPWRITGTN